MCPLSITEVAGIILFAVTVDDVPIDNDDAVGEVNDEAVMLSLSCGVYAIVVGVLMLCCCCGNGGR